MNLALAASPPKVLSSVMESVQPVALVGGAMDHDIELLEFKASLPLDDRRAMVQLPDGFAPHSEQQVTVVVPHRLCDGELRWQVLLQGRYVSDTQQRSSGVELQRGELVDALARVLADRASVISGWPQGGFTLRELAERIAQLIGAEAVFACEEVLLNRVIDSNSPETDTLAGKLRPVLEEAGLMIRQSLSLEGDQVRRVLMMMPSRSGRRIALPWPDSEGYGGLVQSVENHAEDTPVRLWIARGDRPVVEDTFMLEPGWDPSLAGEADSAYGRLTSTDFSLYGPVFRSWVLNEDGAYNDSPYDLVQAFDVGALFDAPGTITAALRFTSCLARNSSGRAVSPVIESSTDSGATWSAYPGSAQVMTDRCGVTLTDDTLPAGILSAAQAGTLRLRVTATIASPSRIEERRWDGNPFAGTGPIRVVPYGERFAWRRVAGTSIHAAAIESGTLRADVADDRAALRAEVQSLVARQAGHSCYATLRLHGAWTSIRPGDRVAEVLGPGKACDGRSARFVGGSARVREVSIRFGVGSASPNTTLKMD